MYKASDVSGRFWNLPQKADEEVARESTFIDDIIQKAHIEREILSNLTGVRTVFDGGAGYGRFSILLAKRGIHVTHFDISVGMIAKAKEIAAREGVLENITFVEGALEDLGAYKSRRYDMVISFDAPISYTYPRQEEVIQTLFAMCEKRMIISVYSRLAWTYLFDPAQKQKYILDPESSDPLVRWTMDHGVKQLSGHRPDMQAVRAFFRSGLMESAERTLAEYEKGNTPWPISYAFMPDELKGVLEGCGARGIALAGPGALSRAIPGEVLRNIMGDEAMKREFLEFCYWYDSQPWCAGMGKDNILARAEK